MVLLTSGVDCECPFCLQLNLISNADYRKPGENVRYFCGPKCVVPYLERKGIPYPIESFTLSSGVIRVQDKPKSWIHPRWLQLAGELLDRAADEFSNHGCNDWDWPKDMTVEQRRQLADEIVASNVNRRVTDLTREDLDEVARYVENGPPDWLLMRFLSKRLIQAGAAATTNFPSGG